MSKAVLPKNVKPYILLSGTDVPNCSAVAIWNKDTNVHDL